MRAHLMVAGVALHVLLRADTLPRPDPLNGVVSGTVVEGTERTPVPGARVKLAISADDPREYEVLTDEDGRFEFERVKPDAYWLAAVKPGYAVGYYRGPETDAQPPAARIVVESARTLRDIELRIARGGVISGRVLDPHGQPAPGVEIDIRPADPQLTSGFEILPSPSRMLRTNALGEYRISGLAAGDYILSAADDRASSIRVGSTDAKPTAIARVFHPGTSDPSAATPVTVRSNVEITNVDFHLRRVPLFRIEGLIAPASSRFASVELLNGTGDSIGSARGTSSTGHFEISDVPSGTYSLVGEVRRRDESERGMWGMMRIVVDRDLTDVVLPVYPGTIVAGQVLVTGPKGDTPAAAHSSFVFLEAEPRGSATGSHVGYIQADGRYQLSTVPPGRYRVAVVQLGSPRHDVVSLAAGGRTLKADLLDVESGSDVLDLVVRVRVRRP